MECLTEVEKFDLLVPEAMSRLTFDLPPEDRNFSHELVYGTFRWLPGLEGALEALCKPAKLPPRIRWLLLCSLYQLRFLRVPDYAVLNEAQKIVRFFKLTGLKGLVNGVLRNATRKLDSLFDGDASQAILPAWLRDLLADQYGPALYTSWVEAWKQPAVTCYWSKSGQGSPDDEKSSILPHGFRKGSSLSPSQLQGSDIYIQNESSQAIAEMALRSGACSILDLCAAPGGKICYMASFGKLKRLVGCDPSARRNLKLVENQRRLNLDFEIKTAAAQDLTWEGDLFDLVLVDAPCSGTGIIGRHPEVKFLKKGPADQALRSMQSKILKAGWRAVKPGGYLIYTVCSLDHREVPSMPADAVANTTLLQAIDGLPVTESGHRFFFHPGPAFDGFSGMVLSRPKSD